MTDIGDYYNDEVAIDEEFHLINLRQQDKKILSTITRSLRN